MSDSYTQALSDAKAELAAVDADFARLEARKDSLQALVNHLEAVVSDTPYPRSLPPLSTSDETPEYLWQQIAGAMRDYGHFTLAQARIGVEAMTGVSIGANAPQKIRNSVIRHPETFERHIDGTYTVKERP